MAESTLRVVLDTNTLLRGLVAGSSAATKVLRAVENRIFIPLLSKPVLDEYREVLSDEALTERFPQLTPRLVDVTLRRLRFISDFVRSPGAEFAYRRDVNDQKFIELAIALDATHILGSDKDLLSLPTGRSEASKRFRQRLPRVQVMAAESFLAKYHELMRPGTRESP